MRRLRHILQHNYPFIILLLISLIYFIITTKIMTYQSIYPIDTKEIEGMVTAYTITDKKMNLTIAAKEKLIVTYYFKEDEYKYYINNIKLGNIYTFSGTLKKPDDNTVPNTFNYREYLYNKHIYYQMQAKKITLVKTNDSLFYEVKTMINNRINKIDGTGYLKTFILGDKHDIDDDITKAYQNIGLSHLFAISGMHISLISALIMTVLKKLTYNQYLVYSVTITILLGYAFLVDLSPSVLRTITMFIWFTINKLAKLNLSSLKVMTLTLVTLIFIDPFIIYQIGFQFSYLITLFLILYKNQISRCHHYWTKCLAISSLSFLVAFPLSVYHFYQVNILSIIISLIIVPLVSMIIFPLCLISFIIPILIPILSFLINILEEASLYLNKMTFFQIIFAKPSFIMVIIYYVLIILTFHYHKIGVILGIMIIVHYFYPYLNPTFNLTIIDVGQGDSLLMSYPYNKTNILVDTGGNVQNKDYSIVINKTIPYLKSLGIHKLDYLITTHGDYDHMGEAINLVNNFKVDKVIFNIGGYNKLEMELIKTLNKKKIKYRKGLESLDVGDDKLYFLNTEEYDNENDNSNVIYLDYQSITFLLMGDASTKKEQDILEKYNLHTIDILKVGHHGSNTSSSKKFINDINPKYSLISVGKNNRYGHPKKSVLDILSNSTIYRTDEDGSITINLNKNEYRIRTCAP